MEVLVAFTVPLEAITGERGTVVTGTTEVTMLPRGIVLELIPPVACAGAAGPVALGSPGRACATRPKSGTAVRVPGSGSECDSATGPKRERVALERLASGNKSAVGADRFTEIVIGQQNVGLGQAVNHPLPARLIR